MTTIDKGKRVSRRGALKTAAFTSAGMFHTAASAAVSAKNPLNTAVVGIGERGKYLIGNLPPEFRVTALCDSSLAQIDSIRNPAPRFGGLLNRFVQQDLPKCKIFRDYRQMLDRQRFEAVIIAAPDHHHALAAILAMQSGAHVYIEKPLAVTIPEGRAIVDAAAKYGRVAQVGSQQRTMQINRTACEFIRDGGIGKVVRVEERNYPGPMPYHRDDFPREEIPSSLNWNLFCGSTPMRAYNKKLWIKDAFDFGFLRWRGWDLLEDYSGHLMTNWGAHSVDMIQFALGRDDTGPVKIELRKDDIDAFVDDRWHDKTPPLGTLEDERVDRLRFCPVVMEYADGTEIHFKPGTRKTVFYGEKGKLLLSRNNYSTQPATLLPPPDPQEQAKWKGDGYVARPHLQNWLDAIQSGRSLHAPVAVGHRTATICHLANLARRLDKSLRWDPEQESIIGDPQANARLHRGRRAGFELPS